MADAFPLSRALAPFWTRTFDVLVIGGGIYGAWTAYDAALRGLSVALIEKNDWASGTSSASSKLIHGGLRYLEHYDFGLVREALVERRLLHRLAPHLVRPLDFVMPVWEGPRASRFLLSAGLFLYDLLGGRGQPVSWHRRYSAPELLHEFPWLDPQRLLGGFRYGDCQHDDARTTLTVVAAAQGAGAVVANQLGAEELLHDAAGVRGARVRDGVSRQTFEVHARTVVNAAGPWAPGLLGTAGPNVEQIKGTHLVLPAIPGCTTAFLLTAADGRVFFVIPWQGRTLVGTTEEEITDPNRVGATDDDVRYLLESVRRGLPGIPWTENDVIARFAGVRTLQAERTENLAAVTREFTLLEPQPRMLLPLGGKFTTARREAAHIVDRLQALLGVKRTPTRTARRPLPGTPETEEPFERWQAAVIPLLGRRGVDRLAAQALTLRYGTRVTRIAELLAENPHWSARLHPELPFITAEAVLAVRDEMALSLEDVIRRRLPLALLVRPEPPWLERLAGILAPEWRRDPAELVAEYARASGARAFTTSRAGAE
ncbi:MAG: glycerol-3-phosphate dehydrogenase/oxidase [Nevskiales bacterium]|nr:glycerol-3-phosphate dehydrogenase/oxidase [Nevskiales bacterium]